MEAEEERQSLRSASISMGASSSPPSETVDQLKELLRQESRCHEETGHCYNTLQREYDELLRKYAEAENTIDKLRIGAKIKLYYEPQKGSAIEENEAFPDHGRSKSTQLIPLAQPQKAHLSRTHSMPDRIYKKRPALSSSLIDEVIEDREAELANRVHCLQNDVTGFHTLLSEGDCSMEERAQFYETLKDEFECVKEELKLMENNDENEGERNRTASDNSRQSEELIGGSSSLQAEVYRLGLRLEEIDEEIGEQIRTKRRSRSHSFNDQFNHNGNQRIASEESNYDANHRRNRELHRQRSYSPSHDDDESPRSANDIERRLEEDLPQNHVENNMYPNYQRAAGNTRLSKSLPRQPTERLTYSAEDINPEESGYYTGRSQPVNVFEEKYLSRSLKQPPTVYSCPETEERVGSWVSKSNQSAPMIHVKDQSGHRRRTKSSEASSMKSNSTIRDRRRRSQTLEEPRKPKSIGPDAGRPFTNNSTEDSGFLDADHRSHASRGQSTPASPTRRFDTVSEASQSHLKGVFPPSTSGERYRERLDSLRNFIQAKREQKENKSRQTPRSWVRSKASSVASSHLSESITISHDNYEPSGPLILPNKATPPRTSGVERRKPFSPNKLQYESNDEVDEEIRFVESDRKESSPLQEKALETLQHEMHDIRDLVLDLKSSLHVKPDPPDTRVVQKTPTKPKIDKRSKPSPRRTPNKDDSFEKKQIEVFEKLTSTMERLSCKIEDLDKQSKYTTMSVASDKTSISAGDLYDENCNSIDKYDGTMIPIIKGMSKRVEHIHDKLSEQNRQKKLKECDKVILRHQADLVKGLENKLSSLENKIETSSKENSYTFPRKSACPLCGGTGAHTHDEEGYKYIHSTPARNTPRVKRPTTPKMYQRTPSKTFHDAVNTNGRVQISPPNVIHHYHTFCGTSSKREPNIDKSFVKSYLTSSPRTHLPQPHTTEQHEKNSTMNGDNLYDSIHGATLAAKRMENLSKRMLSTIAADLFDSNEMTEY